MTPMRKNSYWYQYPDKAMTCMVKFKQVMMPYIELIQENSTINILTLFFKGYADMNPHL